MCSCHDLKNILVEKKSMQRLEDWPQTEDEARDFLQAVFKSMGGKVVPPERPNKKYHKNYAFMMDFENECLSQNWMGPPPIGPKRYQDPKWAKMIQTQVFPFHSDIDWVEYVEFCESGHGDEWFQEDEEKSIPE